MQSTTTATLERPQMTYRSESKALFIVILELFFSRWMLICAIFFSASLWSYLALARAPDTFEATGQVLLRRVNIQALQNLPIMRQQEEVGSEVDIMLSIPVLNETVDQLLTQVEAGRPSDLGEQPLIFGYRSSRPGTPLALADLPTTDKAKLCRMLKNDLRVQKFGESNVSEVSLISPSGRFAAAAVNSLLDVYEKFSLRAGRNPGQANFFLEEITKVDREIDTLNAVLATYKQKHVVVNPEKESELMALRRYGLQTELDKLQQDMAALRTDLDAVADPATRLQTAFLRKDESIQKLREALFFQQNQLAELRSKLTPENPLVIAKQEEVAEQRRNLAREEELAIAQQHHLYRQATDRERQVLYRIAEIDREMGTVPGMQAQIEKLDRDIKQRTIKRVDMVEQMYKSATLENSDETLNKVKVLGYAPVPPYAREARKGFKFMVAVVLSLIASFVAAIFVEGLDHTIRKREEIEEQLSVPYLASLSTSYR